MIDLRIKQCLENFNIINSKIGDVEELIDERDLLLKSIFKYLKNNFEISKNNDGYYVEIFKMYLVNIVIIICFINFNIINSKIGDVEELKDKRTLLLKNIYKRLSNINKLSEDNDKHDNEFFRMCIIDIFIIELFKRYFNEYY